MSDPQVSIWLTSEGGTFHYGCGKPDTATALLDRYAVAKVAKGELGPCCQTEDLPCSFDIFDGPDQRDPVVVLSYALARAEGRHLDPPYRCGCCKGLTYGGCCEVPQ